MQHIVSTRPSSDWTRHNLIDDVMCTTHRRPSAGLEARLGNPNRLAFT
jgi:hypothetical protein